MISVPLLSRCKVLLLLLSITPFFDTRVWSLAGSLISLSKPLEFSLLNWPSKKYSAFAIGG